MVKLKEGRGSREGKGSPEGGCLSSAFRGSGVHVEWSLPFVATQ